MSIVRALAVIPARGGSKRIPRKNIRPFAGRPILSWPVKAALDSGLFATVMVSTEDEEIAGIAREAGAETPFLRSAETADDHASLLDVLSEVVGRYARSRVLALHAQAYEGMAQAARSSALAGTVAP